MAKSAGCRPCKAFARKYQRVAALYPHAVFTVVTGDESKETRAMMMAMKVGRGEESFVGALAWGVFLFFSFPVAHFFSPLEEPTTKKNKVRVTPTFFVYKDRALFKTTTGVNENNLKAALDEAAGGGSGSAAAAAAEGAAAEEEAAAAWKLHLLLLLLRPSSSSSFFFFFFFYQRKRNPARVLPPFFVLEIPERICKNLLFYFLLSGARDSSNDAREKEKNEGERDILFPLPKTTPFV
jgi:hypothetical protein